MTIREIDKKILACIDPETGEVDAEAIDKLRYAREKKIRNVANWILDLEGDVEKVDAEIARLLALKEQQKRKIDGLNGFLRYALQDQPYDGDTFKVRFTRSRALKDPTPETIEKLPEEFLIRKTVETVKPDKKKLKAALDEGWSFAGVEIEERVSVKIK